MTGPQAAGHLVVIVAFTVAGVFALPYLLHHLAILGGVVGFFLGISIASRN
jgi:hypothetical protein